MRAAVQRVSEASVVVEGSVCGRIEKGLLVYLGVERDDAESDAAYIAEKVRHVRIFPDGAGRMNLDVAQVCGKVLVVSAFTLHGDARRGRRPSFEAAADPDRAIILYEMVCDALAGGGVHVERGRFGALMDVRSTNAGPICILLESRRKF
jgi:D-tyrosyl-tRNA(Tyr) deacylase